MTSQVGTQPHPWAAGCLKTPLAHSCPWTQPCPPEDPGPGPAYAVYSYETQDPAGRDVGPSSAHQWANTNPRIQFHALVSGHQHSISGILNPSTSGWTAGTEPQGPTDCLVRNETHSRGPENPSTSPFHQKANTTSEIPWTTQPATLRSNPAPQWVSTSPETP